MGCMMFVESENTGRSGIVRDLCNDSMDVLERTFCLLVLRNLKRGEVEGMYLMVHL